MAKSRVRGVVCALVMISAGAGALGCDKGPRKPAHRERFASKDVNCREAERPQAFLIPPRAGSMRRMIRRWMGV